MSLILSVWAVWPKRLLRARFLSKQRLVVWKILGRMVATRQALQGWKNISRFFGWYFAPMRLLNLVGTLNRGFQIFSPPLPEGELQANGFLTGAGFF